MEDLGQDMASLSSLATPTDAPPVLSEREINLLERTRSELLKGRDFWICIDCEIEIPSLTVPCGKCNKMISFVPLEIGEFEEFIRKQSFLWKKR